MTYDVVHIKEGLLKVSYCGEDLIKSTFDPFLYTTHYSPYRDVYSIMQVIHVGTSYPIFEQVCVSINPNFCDDCLAGLGLVLLGDLGEKVLSL